MFHLEFNPTYICLYQWINRLHSATSTKILPVDLSLEGHVTPALCLFSYYTPQHCKWGSEVVNHYLHDSRPNHPSAALRIQAPFRPCASASQGGGMCSDSESAGGSSESRSMDSPTASPGEAVRHSFNLPGSSAAASPPKFAAEHSLPNKSTRSVFFLK